MRKRTNIIVTAQVFILFLLVILAASVRTNAAPQEKKVIVAGDAQFPPYEFVDGVDGEQVYRGFNVDILKAVALEIGYEIDFRPMIWANAFVALDKGEVDAIEGMKYDAERAQRYDFSDEYMINSQAIFVLKDTHIISDENDLSGHKVAVETDDIAYQRLKNKSGVELVQTKDQKEAFRLLEQGSVSAVVGNKLTGEYILEKTGLMDKVKIVGSPIDPQKYCVAVKKGNNEFLNAFNMGLKEIKKNGTYDKIYAKWFGQTVDYPAAYYKRYLTVTLLGLSILALIVVIFLRINYILKREVKKRAAEIEIVSKELERKDRMEALGNLVASIAHEIRTPLTSIKTFTELIPAKFDNPTFREKISKYVPEEIDRLNTIVNDLLNYAHPHKPFKEPTSVKELVDNTLILFNERIKDNQIKLKVDIDDTLAVFVDKLQIKQVLINVILNALQAIEKKEHPSLKIYGYTKGFDVTVEFADNGYGISDSNISRIFDPFYTTKSGGTGLGLFVSYRLVKENGGEIIVKSVEDLGTTVSLKFPVQTCEVI